RISSHFPAPSSRLCPEWRRNGGHFDQVGETGNYPSCLSAEWSPPPVPHEVARRCGSSRHGPKSPTPELSCGCRSLYSYESRIGGDNSSIFAEVQCDVAHARGLDEHPPAAQLSFQKSD